VASDGTVVTFIYTYQFTSDWCWSAMAGVLASVAVIGNLLVAELASRSRRRNART
jgi:hypothetical protein